MTGMLGLTWRATPFLPRLMWAFLLPCSFAAERAIPLVIVLLQAVRAEFQVRLQSSNITRQAGIISLNSAAASCLLHASHQQSAAFVLLQEKSRRILHLWRKEHVYSTSQLESFAEQLGVSLRDSSSRRATGEAQAGPQASTDGPAAASASGAGIGSTANGQQHASYHDQLFDFEQGMGFGGEGHAAGPPPPPPPPPLPPNPPAPSAALKVIEPWVLAPTGGSGVVCALLHPLGHDACPLALVLFSVMPCTGLCRAKPCAGQRSASAAPRAPAPAVGPAAAAASSASGPSRCRGQSREHAVR